MPPAENLKRSISHLATKTHTPQTAGEIDKASDKGIAYSTRSVTVPGKYPKSASIEPWASLNKQRQLLLETSPPSLLGWSVAVWVRDRRPG